MNNLLSYCGLVGAKIRASDKDLPVIINLDGKCLNAQPKIEILNFHNNKLLLHGEFQPST